MAVGALAAEGAAVLYTAAVQNGSPTRTNLLALLGVTALWASAAVRRTTAGTVELTENGLRDQDGTLIAKLDDIAKVERGMFAFKPSNGFLLRMKSSQSRGWRMGLWWRLGRQIGIGGMLPAPETKRMAERIATLLESRDDQVKRH